MMRSSRTAVCAIVASALLAACGGGGGQPSSTLPASTSAGNGTTTKAASGPTAPLTVTVKIPNRTASSAAVRAAAANARRSPKYVSPGTQSMTVTTLPSSTSASVNCTTGPTCTLSLAAVATDTSINVTLYDSSSIPLSIGTTAIALTAGVPSTVSLTLDGVTPAFTLTAAVSQLVVNYPQSFTATTEFPDYSLAMIGTIGNVVDTSDNVIVNGTGAPINVSNSSTDGTVSVAPPTFNAGPPYSLTQTVTYSGVGPASSPIDVYASQTNGIGEQSNALSLPVVSPLTLTTSDTTYQFIAPLPPAVAAPNYTAEFVNLAALSPSLTVTANYGALAALPTTLTATSDTCTSGGYISGLTTGPFTLSTAPVTFNIVATSPTGTLGCTISLQDNAAAPNSLTLQLFIDNAQVIIQGKKRK